GNGQGHLDRRPCRRAVVPRGSCRLRLEALEDRTMPRVFTVTNLADSGPGSLRQAVLDANVHPGIDVIDFAPGLQGTITLTGGQLGITGGLFVTGPGDDQLPPTDQHRRGV